MTIDHRDTGGNRKTLESNNKFGITDTLCFVFGSNRSQMCEDLGRIFGDLKGGLRKNYVELKSVLGINSKREKIEFYSSML